LAATFPTANQQLADQPSVAQMTDKQQRSLAHTIMSESYGLGNELDADLRSLYRRPASRLKLILNGTEYQPGSALNRQFPQ
jgi:hypothetical protein